MGRPSKAKVYDIEKEEIEQLKGRAVGLYYAITTHSTLPGTFQLSLMRIGEEATLIKHVNSRLIKETKTMSQEMIGKNNLLLTLKEDDSVLFFYLYIGTVPKPPFIQGVILYNNLYGNVVSNLAVFARIKDMTPGSEKVFFENFEPQRGSSNIPDMIAPHLALLSPVVEKDPTLAVIKNIQYFLLQKADPLITKVYNNLLPFDFSKSVAAEPGPYGQDGRDYNKAKALSGDYYIYFTERYKSANEIKEEPLLLGKDEEFSTVGKGIFKIYRDEKSGAMRCTMRTRKDTNGTHLEHEGYIINTRLGVSPYLLTSLYSGQDDGRCIVLLFKIIDDKKMTGGHVIAYSVPGKLGAGSVVMVRQEVIDGERKKDAPEPEPQALIPHSPKIMHLLEKRIVNYLSLKNRGLVEPPEEYEALETYGADNTYEGLYRLYEAKDDGQGFAISVLRIYREGFVTHIDARGDRATGIVAKVDDFLSITLKNEVLKRTGFLCVKVNAESTPPIQGETIYPGTFAGVSRPSSKDIRGPVASQFFMEFCGKTESPDIKPEERIPDEALPLIIRKIFPTVKIKKLSFAEKPARP